MLNNTLEKWEEKTLGEVCTITAGQSPESQFYNTEGNGLPFYQGKKEFTNKYIGAPTVWTTKITKEALAGDILMSVRAPVGSINYATQKCCIGRGLASIRKSEKISNDFLFYYLLSMQEEIGGHDGAVFNSISRNEIATLKIKLPLLSEQQRIVGILDEVFENIEKAKQNTLQNLNNAKELSNTKLNKLINKLSEKYNVLPLKDITTKLGDGLHGTPQFNDNGNIYFVNGNNLNDGRIIIKSDTKLTTEEEYNKYKKDLNETTVLVSINGTVGNVAFYNNEKIILGKSACYFNLKENISKQYIKQLIQSNYFLNYANKNASEMTIKNVSLAAMRNFPVPLPPLQEQKEVANCINEFNKQTKKLEQIYTQKLQDLDELKQSILQKAFNGEL